MIKKLAVIGIVSGIVVIAASYVNAFSGIGRVVEERRALALSDFDYDRRLSMVSLDLTAGYVIGALVSLGSGVGYILYRVRTVEVLIHD